MMALTLEATIVLPLTAAITLGILSAGIYLAGQVRTDIQAECRSILESSENREIFEAKILINAKENIWSKSISVNPVKMKQTIGFMMDTYGYLDEYIPFIRNIGGADDAGH
ncbi:MAG: hypothetical protein ACYCYM_01145 [Saccharofermentanales bacterium]